MSIITFEGGREYIQVLKNIPKNIEDRGVKAAMRKAAKPIVRQARRELTTSPAFENQRTAFGFSKMLFVARNIKAVIFKRGVNIQIDPKATDVPVLGSKRPEWTTYGWGRLLAQGRQWTAKSTASRRAHNTGTTKGAGDFVQNATDKMRTLAMQIYNRNLNVEIQKALDRSTRQYGKRSSR